MAVSLGKKCFLWFDLWPNQIYRVCILKWIKTSQKEVFQIVKRRGNKAKQNKKFDMICPKNSNNVKYWHIKMNKLFGLDRKSRINNLWIIVQKQFKMAQKRPKWPLFDISKHYSTLKKVFVLHAKWIGWPDSIWFVYRIPKWMLNFFE